MGKEAVLSKKDLSLLSSSRVSKGIFLNFFEPYLPYFLSMADNVLIEL